MNLYRMLRNLRKSPDNVERDRLMARLNGRRYFTEDELNEIFSYRRLGYHHNANAVEITTKAFEPDSSLGDGIRVLKRLNGVDMASASLILSFQNPFSYAELDSRAWNKLRKYHGFKGVEKDFKSDFSTVEYGKYLEALKLIAEDYGMRVADVQFVLASNVNDD
ncbi:MAG: hypothetical protein GF416_03175 [Candidatus Altiarchaeales archaeon]|nr:hypothetical protein [Candidatus Altiarchaeales archaeon]MBD3416122.1 hypothetical protein [Candidatus Altiarchaeales archaeon]